MKKPIFILIISILISGCATWSSLSPQEKAAQAQRYQDYLQKKPYQYNAVCESCKQVFGIASDSPVNTKERSDLSKFFFGKTIIVCPRCGHMQDILPAIKRYKELTNPYKPKSLTMSPLAG